MKKFARWIVWILILEFLFFFALGLRLRHRLEAQTVHFVSAPAGRALPRA